MEVLAAVNRRFAFPNSYCNPELTPCQFKDAISYGVVKVNLDTDMQVSPYDPKFHKTIF